MLKIGMLLPEAGMVETAKRIIKEDNMDNVYLKAIHTVDTVNEARMAIEAGVHILVARGYQAKLIKQYTNIPLVEMRFHAQEIGLLIQKAKSIVKKEHISIGLIAFENMLCDLSYMEKLFDVDLKVIYLKRMEEADQALWKLSENKERPDIIIGGEETCRAAENMGYPTLFYESTEESVREALIAAKNISYAAESEKMSTAQFETVLDTSFNGIIKVNSEGKIIVINKLAENLIGKNSEEVMNREIAEVFPEIDIHLVEHVLKGERESCSTSVSMRNKSWMVLIAPIQYDNKITGAIISLQKIADATAAGKSNRNDSLIHGFTARTVFRDIKTENIEMENVIATAKSYALSESPVVIYGQPGVEDYLIAEAIHNNSNRRAGAYVSLDMHGMDKQKQMEVLFQRDSHAEYGYTGAMFKANHGTLFLKGIEYMTQEVQQQILRTMLSRSMMRTDALPLDLLDVRLIVSSGTDLRYLVEKKGFSEELYYQLQGLTLRIPALNERPEDLRSYFEQEINAYSEKYNRHLKITEGGYKKLQELKWTGNLIQVKTYCERLALSADKRNVDEVLMQKVYQELYPNVEWKQGERRVVVYQSEEAVELGKLLEQCHGNRKAVAEKLGISTTTLWRKMKKYGIEANFGNKD